MTLTAKVVKVTTDSHNGGHHAPPEPIPPNEVVEDLVSRTAACSKFKRLAWILGILAVLGVIGVIGKIIDDGGDTTKWGYVAAIMAFLLTAGGGAPMVAIAPALAKANWVRPVSRIAALFSLVGVVTSALLIPLLVLLPPLIVDETRRRTVWFEGPNYSPHFWGIVALVGLTITGLALLYSSALPDLAAMRDHASGWRQRWAEKLARGWRGTDVQWRTLRMRIGMFGTLYFLILVFTHFLISTDFAMSMVPGWRDAIFPFYHAISSIQAGIASVVLALWIARRFGGMERYLHLDQFWSLGKLLFAFSLLWFYFFFSAFIVFWYGRANADVAWLDLLIRGPMIYGFLIALFACFIAPWWLLIWNRVRTSVNGPPAVAALVLFGILVDRIRLYVPSWSVPGDQIHYSYLSEIPGTLWPDVFDILVIIGAISASLLLMLLATRLIPAVSIWEIQQMNLLSRPVKYLRTHGVLVAKPD